MAKTSEAQIRASMKYNRVNVKHVNIELNVNTDADIIAWLGLVDSKLGYIKELIREDIAKNGQSVSSTDPGKYQI